jgi:hypothetical protein
MVMEL